MNSIKKLREALGLTQQQLADYLSVTRSELSMAEINHRQLPGPAMLKMAALQQGMASNKSSRAAAEINKQTIKARNILSAQAQQYTLKAAMARQKLELLQRRHQQCVRTLQAVAACMSSHLHEKDRLWLEVLERQTLKKMDACGLHVQSPLEVQATVYAYHARHIQSLLI